VDIRRVNELAGAVPVDGGDAFEAGTRVCHKKGGPASLETPRGAGGRPRPGAT
jgi:hypothetical protein